MKVDLISPWVWQNDQSDSWYFKKQNDSLIWIEYYSNAIWDTFTQVSIKNDNNIYPVIILNNSIGLEIYLTERLSYWKRNATSKKTIITGYWTKKNGLNIIIS